MWQAVAMEASRGDGGVAGRDGLAPAGGVLQGEAGVEAGGAQVGVALPEKRIQNLLKFVTETQTHNGPRLHLEARKQEQRLVTHCFLHLHPGNLCAHSTGQ